MLLPPDDVKRDVIAAYAAMRIGFGEELGKRPLVLPTGDFFPDTFSRDAKGVKTLVKRMQAHAGMLDIPVQTLLDGDPAGACSTGACATGCATALPPSDGRSILTDTGDEWLLELPREELAHPVVLTTRVARALSTIFYVETDSGKLPRPLEPAILVDLLGVGLGFGALMMEGAYVYTKSCGGPNVAKLTTLGLPELTLLVALFCGDQPKSLRLARKSLGTTQSAALEEAESWSSGNRELLGQLREAPELLVGGAFELGSPRSNLWSWLQRDREPTPPVKALTTTRAKLPPKPEHDDGLRELVEEALAASPKS